MTDEELEKILLDPGVVRNRLKVYSVRKNALAAIEILKEFGSLDAYFWSYVDHAPIISHCASLAGIRSSTEVSDRISKDLKKR